MKAYAILHPTFSTRKHWDGPFKDERILDKVAVSKIFAKKPPRSSLSDGDVVLELEIEVDEAAFYPPRPKVSINIPAEVDEDDSVTTVPVVRYRRKSIAARVVED